MLDRVLAVLLRLVLTTLIAGIAAGAVISAYSGFIQLLRKHFVIAGWMLGMAVVAGFAAYALGTRRGDLVDC